MSRNQDDGRIYEIRVRGWLNESWSDWLTGAAVTFEDEPAGLGSTLLIARLDQAALRGLLNRLWDLNLTVVSVELRDAHAVPPAPSPSEVDIDRDCEAASGTGYGRKDSGGGHGSPVRAAAR